MTELKLAQIGWDNPRTSASMRISTVISSPAGESKSLTVSQVPVALAQPAQEIHAGLRDNRRSPLEGQLGNGFLASRQFLGVIEIGGPAATARRDKGLYAFGFRGIVGILFQLSH